MEQYPKNQQASIATYGPQEYYVDKSIGVSGTGFGASPAQVGSNEWPLNQIYSATPFGNAITYSFAESQSDGDITPSDSVLDGTSGRWN